ncbi:MAG: hypothetical protein KAT35_02290, partial [Candidatus Aenigmarchaeota archaeon]|nr:hypothetical protein [Candidatus Aenigmarchaeota archaeon]
AFAGLGLILLKNHLFPLRFCNWCGKRLFLPWGADHFSCALWNYPDIALEGWYYYLRGEYEKEEALQEQIRKGPSELRAKFTVFGRMLLIGPLMAILLSPFIFPIAWANWLTTISHISLICIVFLSNVIYMRDYNRKTGWDIIIVSIICVMSPLCYSPI